ncbi:hypothetical protein VP01_1263g2 [Puccinia sorghi]|uniref:Uncharacterized protein n=1 Tax=Puccinia sorghi TaxID=27349 RepID=A0A0L6VP35_9BASI|nr:hypothetical protein VP01_1263g2 [Puccinia sorghi]
MRAGCGQMDKTSTQLAHQPESLPRPSSSHCSCIGTTIQTLANLMTKVKIKDKYPSGSQKGKSSTSSSHPAPPTTPLNQKRKFSTPKTELPKGSPFQMVSKNMPESFSTTRDALYVHLKLLWGLMEQKTVPPSSQESMKDFHSCFSNADMIKSAEADEGAPTIIPVSEVVSLASLKAGRIEEFHFAYSKATLACLGIRKQAALKTFHHAVVGCAYAYMNKKEVGKFRMDEERKVISRARDRLCDPCLKFSLKQRLPKRYQAVISNTSAHKSTFPIIKCHKIFPPLRKSHAKGLWTQSSQSPQKGSHLTSIIRTGSMTSCHSRDLTFLTHARCHSSQMPINLYRGSNYTLRNDGESENEDDRSSVGEEIDLAHTSGSDKEDEEMDEEDADFVDDEEMGSAGEDNNQADTEDDDADCEARYQEMLIDEDLPDW